MIIRDYVIFLCIYYWKRNTDDLDPIHPALLNRSPMLKQIKICLLRNTLRHDLIVHTTIQVTRGSSEKSLHKSKRSFEWRIFSSSCGTHLLGSQTDSDKTYDPVMTSQHWSIILMKRSDLQKSASSATTQGITPIHSSCYSPWGESLQARSNSPWLE